MKLIGLKILQITAIFDQKPIQMHGQRLISLPPVMVEHFHRFENKDPGEWHCDADPEGKRAGSGGGTASLQGVDQHVCPRARFLGQLARGIPEQ